MLLGGLQCNYLLYLRHDQLHGLGWPFHNFPYQCHQDVWSPARSTNLRTDHGWRLCLSHPQPHLNKIYPTSHKLYNYILSRLAHPGYNFGITLVLRGGAGLR